MKKALSRILSVILAIAMIVSATAIMPVSAADDNVVKAEAAQEVSTEFSLDFTQKDQEIADTMYGIFFEDINWAGDGGLYPEKFTNRSFEYFGNDWNAYGSLTGHNRTTDAQAHRHGWLAVGDASFEVVQGDEATAMNKNNTYYANVKVNEDNAGILNYGYGNITGRFNNGNEVVYPGMNFKAGDVYYFSMYVYGAVDTDVTVTLYGAGGSSEIGMFTDATYEVGKVTFPVKTTGSGWQQVKAEVTVEKDVAVDGEYQADGFAAITFADAGDYTLDFISLYPQATYNNRENGLRPDLVEMLKGLNPGFMRFPGGCIVEGVGPTNRYNWKNTVGPIEERKLDWCLWNEYLYAGGESNTYYYQSFGLGFYEYMLLCEDIGCEPMPVFNAGMACELRAGALFQNEDKYAAGTDPATFNVANLQPFIDDAIDFMDFCLADPAENEWAALRAEMGHPEPFDLNFVSIGNEQSNAIFAVYYDAFITQMREAYPDIKYIPSWNQGDTMYTWLIEGNANSPGAKSLEYAWASDEHYYVSSESSMYGSYTTRYDNYPRLNADGETRTYVFAGEYSLRTNAHNYMLSAALAEAAVMTGMERNSDLVKMASYAPLFFKDGFGQWDPSLIFFTEYTTYGKPSYYTQKMFGQNPGDYYIQNSVSYKELLPEGIVLKADGKAGIGSSRIRAQFDSFKVTSNADGSVIADYNFDDIAQYNDNFVTGGSNGTWSVTDGILNQGSTSSNRFSVTGADTLENYTIETKAAATSSSTRTDAGVMVAFLYKNSSNYYSVLMNSTGTIVRKTAKGATTTIATSEFVPELNRFYDIKVEVTAENVKVSVDGDVIAEATVSVWPYSMDEVADNAYTSASYDEDANEIIIKAINPLSVEMPTKFDLGGVDYVNPVGKMIQMKGNGGKTGENNTNNLENPENISDVHYTFEGFDTTFYYTLPEYSFTIFRISLDNDANKIASIDAVPVETSEGIVPVLPTQVVVNYADGHQGVADVEWEFKPDSLYSIAGEYEIDGDVKGTNLDAVIDLTVTETPDVADAVSVNGKTDGSAVAKINSDIIISFTVEAGAYNIGIRNENGKFLGKRSAVVVDNGDGTETWTIVTSVSTKGERVFGIYADYGDGLADTGLVAPVKIVKEINANVLPEAAIIEAKTTNELAIYKVNKPITVIAKTNFGAEKIGVFNENGAGISKSIVDITDNGDGTYTWTIAFSVGSAGSRTLTVKAGNNNGWSEGIDLAVRIVK